MTVDFRLNRYWIGQCICASFKNLEENEKDQERTKKHKNFFISSSSISLMFFLKLIFFLWAGNREENCKFLNSFQVIQNHKKAEIFFDTFYNLIKIPTILILFFLSRLKMENSRKKKKNWGKIKKRGKFLMRDFGVKNEKIWQGIQF